MKFIQFTLAVACMTGFSVSAAALATPVRVNPASTVVSKPASAPNTTKTNVKPAPPVTTTNAITPVNSPIHLANSLATITVSQKCSNEKNKKENGC